MLSREQMGQLKIVVEEVGITKGRAREIAESIIGRSIVDARDIEPHEFYKVLEGLKYANKPNNRWNAASYALGMEGERLFYEVISAYIRDFPPPSETLYDGHGDGGRDFWYRGLTIQVKTNYRKDRNRLEHLKLSGKDIERANLFVLMSLCVDGNRFEGFVVKDNIKDKLRTSEKFHTPYIHNRDLNKSVKELVKYLCA